MKPIADTIRQVPEFAVRLYLGAAVRQENGSVMVELDGRTYRTDPDIIEKARRVADALLLRPRIVEYATDVLELRQAAEDIWLESLALKDTRLKSVLFFPASRQGASSFYRCMIPADTLHREGSVIAHFTHSLDLGKALRYQVLWIQLAANPVIHTIARTARDHGVRLIYDIDDRMDAVPEENPAHVLLNQDGKIQNFVEMIREADLVTVSTRTLADWVRKFTDRVLVCPNMIPGIMWNPAQENPDPTVRVLWAGSNTHRHDLNLVAPVLCKLLAEHPEVRLLIFGEELPEGLREVRDRVEIHDFVSFEEYPEKLIRMRADIAIAPLVNDRFNACKSGIKALEYGICGYPMILSNVGEYPELVRDGLPAWIASSPQQWYRLLKILIQDPRMRRDMGRRSREWVLKNRCIIRDKGRAWLKAVEEVTSNNSKENYDAGKSR